MPTQASPISAENLAARFLTYFESKNFNAAALAKIKQILEQIKATYSANYFITSAYNYLAGNTAIAERIATLITALSDNIDSQTAFNKVFAFIQTGDWLATGVNNEFISSLLANTEAEISQLKEFFAAGDNGSSFVRVIRFSDFKIVKATLESKSEATVLGPTTIDATPNYTFGNFDEPAQHKPPVSPVRESSFPFSAFSSKEVAASGFGLSSLLSSANQNVNKDPEENAQDHREALRFLLDM